MNLVIDGVLIDAPIIDILNKAKSCLTNGKLSSIIQKDGWVSITCPFHSNGVERHNSCGVVSDPDSDKEYGTFNCFSCKENGPLYHLIAGIFDRDDDFGKRWLVTNFGNTLLERDRFEEDIVLKKDIIPIQNDISLDGMLDYHPYMTKRKLTEEVINTFKIKYDPRARCLVFPVWDECDRLSFLTRRSVDNKHFFIPSNVEKPVYLLNYIIKNNIKTGVVCESQINALTCWTHHIPAIALFGTGSSRQYEILNRSGIRNYILAFDGDDAGDRGRDKFIKNISKKAFIDVINIPRGKDVNELSTEEFNDLFQEYNKCVLEKI